MNSDESLLQRLHFVSTSSVKPSKLNGTLKGRLSSSLNNSSVIPPKRLNTQPSVDERPSVTFSSHASRVKSVQEDNRKTLNEFITFLHSNPSTTEFRYLVWNSDDVFNPYDLRIVAYTDIETKHNYYTISSKGVTHFSNNETDFVDLNTWLRQRSIFSKLIEIPLFKKCTIFKSFTGWKKMVRQTKISKARTKLQTGLFAVNPVLFQCLLVIQGHCSDIRSLKLCTLGSTDTLELSQFIEVHKIAVDDVSTRLQLIFEQIRKALKNVCDDVMDNLVKHNREESSIAGMIQSETKSGSSEFKPKSIKKSVAVNGGRALSYQEMAARRSECRRLMAFVRLVDYLVFDAVFSMTLSSLQTFTTRLSSSRDSSNTPLFSIEALFDTFADRIEVEPSVASFMDVMKTLLEDYKTVLTCYQSLVSHDDFVSFFREDLGMSLGTPSPEHGTNVLISMIKDSVAYRDCVKILRDSIKQMFAQVDNYFIDFTKFSTLLSENSEISISSLPADLLTLEFFSDSLVKYKSQVAQIESIPDSVVVSGIIVKLEALKAAFLPSPSKCISEIEDILPELAKQKNEILVSNFQSCSALLRAKPSTVGEFVDFLDHLSEAHSKLEIYRENFDEVKAFYHLIQEHAITVSEIDLAVFRNLSVEFDEVVSSIEVADSQKDEGITTFAKELVTLIKTLHTDVADVVTAAQDAIIGDADADVNMVISYVSDLAERAKQLDSQASLYRKYAERLEVTSEKADEFEDVVIMVDDVTVKYNLWTSYQSWIEQTSTWVASRFDSLDSELLQKQVTSFLKTAAKCERTLVKNTMAVKFKKAVDLFKHSLPVIIDLRNDKLKLRHRQKMEVVLNSKFPEEELLTLGWLIDHGALKCASEINAISVEATNEASLEALLRGIEDGWNEVDLELVPHRDTKDYFIIATVDDIVTQLEDNMQLLSTMRGSRYVSAIESHVADWETRLNIFQESLDAWLECQRNWIYLENIFNAPDIAKQLPEESKLFQKVDLSFKEIMRQARELPNALRMCTTSGLLQTFKKNNTALEKIQKALDNYLEKKRASFPRFYFLSNDELLEILSQSRNPEAVQPHLRKCFDGIGKLRFSDDPTAALILAMISPEGEEVPLSRIKARGDVCKWLNDVQTAMRDSLKKILRNAIQEYTEFSLEEWLIRQPAQVIIAVVQIFWAKEITEALIKSKNLEISNAHQSVLQEVLRNNSALLNRMSAMMSSNLTSLQREAIVALITIYVHSRDIVEEMVQEGVSSTDDFGWTKRLRYYWSEDVDNCEIRQTNTCFIYGYEYLGCTPRLVITPLTDRCYITLTGALHNKLGGSPAGPAGTGKTETTKDLAKALGRLCVVFNCSEQIDCLMMERLFAGLVQAGAWTCLDEFNRIGLEVLSVVAQQVLTIRTAILTDSQTFEFGNCGRIPLNPNCGIFITMNPGYAGRTELPDNLQTLFRPVSMMVPDYALIAEIMLYSEGFTNARVLSKKMVQLYKLSSEQLSQQDHYDFGMRAVKTSLRAAGALRRRDHTVPEDILIYRALYVESSPKFTAQDSALFLGILSDLFPGVVVPKTDYGAFEAAIKTVINRQGLEVIPKQISKVIQLHETLGVRHGVMVVGPTMGGKSVVLKTLSQALTYLRSEVNHPDEAFQVVKTHSLNPKSITMGQLYGEVNPLTKDWKNGVVTRLVLSATQDQSKDFQWVLFDGPVDALWIENMNTVLDDNKMLCLANGLRIKLSPTTFMIFEVEDLAVASPATVSRCGMVYVDPVDLGWKPFINKWVEREFESQGKSMVRDHVIELIDNYLPKIFEFIQASGSYYIKPAVLNLFVSFSNIFSSLFKSENGVAIDFVLPQDMEDASDAVIEELKEKHLSQLTILCNHVFFFSVIWSFGACLVESSRPEFDGFLRDLVGNKFQISTGNVYDYSVDLNTGDLTPWSELVSEYQYDPKVPFFAALVPTVDTVRFSYILEKLQEDSRPVLFTGGSGVGKSVIIQDFLTKITGDNTISAINVTFSAQSSANRTQDMLESKLEQKRKGFLGPAGLAKKAILFIDDLNMPKKEVYGAQPPVELLRQILDYKGFYEREKGGWYEIQNMSIVCACAPPGGGRSEVTARVTRHFNQLVLPQPSPSVLSRIFGCLLSGYLGANNFKKEIQSLSEGTVAASIEVYDKVLAEMRPTPTKSHYTFNLRDLSKVIQGITMIKSKDCFDTDTFVRLWCHESMRVFHDRLVSEDDRIWFKKTLLELSKKHLSVFWNYEEVFEAEIPMLFGDVCAPSSSDIRPYQHINDWEKVLKTLNDSLEDYNVSSSSEMDLVFFQDAVLHIARIARVLRQPRGNALLVGVGGSGKQSLTRLAAHIAEFQLFRIELTRNYSIINFREDLRKMYSVAGVEGKSVVFLLSDTQIVDESFLEDVNNILNSGEVPNLYENEEYDNLITKMRPIVRELGLPETKDAIYRHFIQRVRDNLHVVLCMSPVGSTFRTRCRQFPSLINCCTIDWFDPWPRNALLSVARHFLQKVELGGPAVTEAIALTCVDIHQSVVENAELFFQRLRRRYYTTPTSYLELLRLYLIVLAEKHDELAVVRDKLLNGLQKLAETNKKTDEMKVELTDMEPILKDSAEKTAALLIQLEKDQAEAASIKATVQAEEIIVSKQAAEANAIAEDAQRDLDEALPQLEGAIKALDALKTSDIYEIKAFIKPPQLVQTVMEAVCILMGSKPEWAAAKQLLSDTQLIPKLRNYKSQMDEGQIPNSTFSKLASYIENPEFVPEVVRNVSVAAMSLCMWARAIDVYHKVSKTVEPKKARLREAQANLAASQAQLKEKQIQLKKVEDQLAELHAQYESQMASKQRLELKISDTSARLSRAAKLAVLLADEQIRWKASAEGLSSEINTLVGTMLISAGCLSYLGAFTTEYRTSMINSWVQLCRDRKIPICSDFSLIKTLCTPVKVREWNIQGLPTDDVSIENAVISTRARRWPLFIDPQGQAVSWIQSMENQNGLKVVKMTSATSTQLIRTLEQAVYIGTPVLLEDIGEDIDPALEPILLKKVFKSQGRDMIRIGDSDVQYDKNFRLYLTTKLPNPHYLPEVCITVTILNFTVTKLGLENQLLGDVVKNERPSLEADRDHLILSMANDRKQLKDFEDQILHLINTTDNVLDDDGLINTLNQAKITSAVISERVVESEETEKQINLARESFRPMAKRGSILYFVITDLGLVDSMYQYSLTYFNSIFSHVLKNAAQSDDLNTRLDSLISSLTALVYDNICRGLFERDKLTFAFLIGTSIARSVGDIDENDWSFFLRGPTSLDAKIPPKTVEWLSENEWEQVYYLSRLPTFNSILKNLVENSTAWNQWRQSDDLSLPLPSPYDTSLTKFQWLMVIKVLKTKLTVFAVSRYVETTLGQKFIQPPPFDLESAYNDSSPSTPLIFVLSVGADPTTTLLKFAEEKGFSNRLYTRSLGQNQGPIAEQYIQDARKSGDWVYLSNCHLAESWMSNLERIVLSLSTGQVHPQFRLWLSSMPSKVFPVSVLQNGIKITNEPPKGLKANLTRTLSLFNENDWTGHSKLIPWRRLSFALAFFHALVQQRKSWGPTAFNIPYEISESDFAISYDTLKTFLAEQPEIPWAALRYLTAEVHYGGRFTQEYDRRALNTILDCFYRPEVLQQDCRFSELDTYYSPCVDTLEDVKSYVSSLPLHDPPEVFGLHSNAAISLYLIETRNLLSTVVNLQPRSGGSGVGQTPEEIVSQLCQQLLTTIPEDILLSEAHESIFALGDDGFISALSTTLSHEILKYNKILKVVRNSLSDVVKAIDGLVVMSSELEMAFVSLLNNQVPQMWSAVAYPSVKPLNSWVKDLVGRVNFFINWLRKGTPSVFSMPAFSFPQGFLTSVLQVYARKYKLPIDSLAFRFEFIKDRRDVDLTRDGVYVDGLFIESGKWVWDENGSGYIDEPDRGILYAPMPIIHFIPVQNYSFKDDSYAAPLYKTIERRGTLSTTGHSTNFVLAVEVPTVKAKEHWIMRGCALLCALGD
ncbi:hypothetical protein RCL1_004668 [Eukaryota sp. TZLM3-RCL]